MLTERIATSLGNHEPGWRLPRQSSLARTFNATMAEIDAAIRELEARHLIRRLANGRLYRTSPAEYLITLEGLPGIGSHIDPMGATIARLNRHVAWRRAPEDIAIMLGIPRGVPASMVRCQWGANGRCAALSTTYFSRFPGSTPLPNGTDPGSLDDTLNPLAAAGSPGTRDAHIAPVALHIEVQPPSKSEARSLQIPASEPAITVTVSFRDIAHNRPLALTTAVLRSDLFRVVIETPAFTPPPPPGPA